ncbi:glycine zipper 2TM domain-containing protein [Dechloromonas denitrificans]|uniref:glycine zipper 2TM domain-containing protein n=1 Tax=Dechloromonas denitrificans TaxID=281362 RepID=UPI001CF966FD|nr:glycine zipper 2TM domain-containing protein [Dechloromonas denitrificans]UCV07736.1 glycine zipper 2TM domain-containing protein [Dechloromonas denitrificans]
MKTLSLLLLSVILLAGCASSKSGDVYSRDQARREQTVRQGVVESVRAVQMEGTKSPVGTVAGAAVGGIAGSTLGHGKGSAVTAVIGAVAGGLAGAAIEEGVTRRQAMEITVQLDGGRLIVIVQEGDPQEFRPGDRVRVLSSGGESRVTR